MLISLVFKFQTETKNAKPTLPTSSLKRYSQWLIAGTLGILPLISQASSDGLVSLYLKAEKHDAMLAQSQHQKAAILKNRPITESALLPKISANGGVNISRYSEEMYDLNSITAGVNLQQPLYQPQTYTQLDQVDKQAQQTELSLQNTRQQLIVRLVNSYFDVIKSEADLQLIKNKEAADKAQYDRTKVSNEAGLVSRTDLLEAKSNLDTTQADVITFRNAYENRVESLETLTGQMVNSIKSLDVQSAIKTTSIDLQKIIKQANKNNISVLIADLDVEQARDNITLQKQSNAPSVNLNIDYGYHDYDKFSEAMAMQYEDRHRFEVGVQASMPLYDGGLEKAKVAQARIQEKEALEKLRHTREQTELSVKQSVRNIKKSKAHVEALKQAKDSSEAFLEATEVSYDSGLRDLVDVLNARTAAMRSKRNLITAQYDLLAEQVNLKAILSDLSIDHLTELDALLTQSIQLK